MLGVGKCELVYNCPSTLALLASVDSWDEEEKEEEEEGGMHLSGETTSLSKMSDQPQHQL